MLGGCGNTFYRRGLTNKDYLCYVRRMETTKTDTCAINLRNVPRDVRQRFKGLCAIRGTNMSDEIIKFMATSAETMVIQVDNN